ncbi:unnamed protein product [Durusdinium trenchii]|uniref:Flavin-containing monooxygenase n=1 Tax=Durusdinium trenchii TaxID=1381693 RepID=A0ABP0MSE3_9DINO
MLSRSSSTEPVAMDCASQLRAALEDVAGATWCPALHFTKLEEAKEALQWIVDVPLAFISLGDGLSLAQGVHTWLNDPMSGVVSRRAETWCSFEVEEFSKRNLKDMANEVCLKALAQTTFDKRCLVLPSQSVPSTVDVVVVGAGLLGMLTAQRCTSAGFSVAVLEQRPVIGGIWSMYANSTSQVNSSEGGYCIKDLLQEEEDGSHDNRDHSTAAEVLKDLAKLGDQLKQHIFTSVKVMKILGEQGSYTVLFENELAQGAGIVQCRGVVLCVNDRVGLPRPLDVPGKESFQGVVADGTSDSLAGVDWCGKRVVIAGMGAFAVENVRTALERGAAEVVVVARRHGTICPKAIDYLNFVKPWDEKYKHDTQTNVKQFLRWKQLYEASGCQVPECWPKQVKHDGHTISVSDIWFIAHHMKKLTTKTGTINRIEKEGVVLSSGDFMACDVVVGCIGFERSNTLCEWLTGRKEVKTTNYLDQHMMYLADAEIDEGAFNSFFGSSVLEYGKFFTNVFVEGLKRPDVLAQQLWGEHTTSVPISQRKWNQYIASAMKLIDADDQIAQHAQQQVDMRTKHFYRTMPPKSFVAVNRREWEELHQRLNGGEPAAPDGATDPEWAVLPDKREGKWRLLKLGTTASNSRCSIGDDEKHKGRHFAPLHKIYFYDAWRVNPISDLRMAVKSKPSKPAPIEEASEITPGATVATSLSLPDVKMTPRLLETEVEAELLQTAPTDPAMPDEGLVQALLACAVAGFLFITLVYRAPHAKAPTTAPTTPAKSAIAAPPPRPRPTERTTPVPEPEPPVTLEEDAARVKRADRLAPLRLELSLCGNFAEQRLQLTSALLAGLLLGAQVVLPSQMASGRVTFGELFDTEILLHLVPVAYTRYWCVRRNWTAHSVWCGQDWLPGVLTREVVEELEAENKAPQAPWAKMALPKDRTAADLPRLGEELWRRLLPKGLPEDGTLKTSSAMLLKVDCNFYQQVNISEPDSAFRFFWEISDALVPAENIYEIVEATKRNIFKGYALQAEKKSKLLGYQNTEEVSFGMLELTNEECSEPCVDVGNVLLSEGVSPFMPIYVTGAALLSSASARRLVLDKVYTVVTKQMLELRVASRAEELVEAIDFILAKHASMFSGPSGSISSSLATLTRLQLGRPAFHYDGGTTLLEFQEILRPKKSTTLPVFRYPIKWVFSLAARAKISSAWNMSLAAVRSSAVHGDAVVPVCLTDAEPESVMVKALIQLGVRVLHHLPSWADTASAVWRQWKSKSERKWKFTFPEFDDLKGACMRLDVPVVGILDPLVLYTDVDILFHERLEWPKILGLTEHGDRDQEALHALAHSTEYGTFTHPSGGIPEFFSMATELIQSYNVEKTDTGVMLMNLRNLQKTYVNFTQFLFNRKKAWDYVPSDPCNYKAFYRSNKGKLLSGSLPFAMSWKPWWEVSSDVLITHFHGPKCDSDILPYVYEGMVRFEPFRSFLEKCSKEKQCQKLCQYYQSYLHSVYRSLRKAHLVLS